VATKFEKQGGGADRGGAEATPGVLTSPKATPTGVSPGGRLIRRNLDYEKRVELGQQEV
jgi:hypothetical protein